MFYVDSSLSIKLDDWIRAFFLLSSPTPNFLCSAFSCISFNWSYHWFDFYVKEKRYVSMLIFTFNCLHNSLQWKTTIIMTKQSPLTHIYFTRKIREIVFLIKTMGFRTIVKNILIKSHSSESRVQKQKDNTYALPSERSQNRKLIKSAQNESWHFLRIYHLSVIWHGEIESGVTC